MTDSSLVSPPEDITARLDEANPYIRQQQIYLDFLTNVTADKGLGYNIAMLFRREGRNTLIGECAVGPIDSSELPEAWSKRYEDLDTYFVQATPSSRLNEAIRGLVIPVDKHKTIEQAVRDDRTVISPSSDSFAQEMISRGIEFNNHYAVTPLSISYRVVGVTVVSNPYSKHPLETNLRALETLSHTVALSIITEQDFEKTYALLQQLQQGRDNLTEVERERLIEQLRGIFTHHILTHMTSMSSFVRLLDNYLASGGNDPEKIRSFSTPIVQEGSIIERILQQCIDEFRNGNHQ